MDLDAIDEDHAAALAAAAIAAAAANDDDLAVGVRVSILSTPDRPKRPITNSPATTPAPSYFSYQSDYQNDYRHAYHDDNEAVQEPDAAGLRTPSLLSSPSVASSLGFSTGRMSPLRREVSRASSSFHSHSRGPSDASPIARRISRPARRNRDALARRLSQLAHELTTGDEDNVDDDGVDILTAQMDHLEGAVMRKPTSFSSPSTPSPLTTPQRPMSLDMRSPGESIFSSPGSVFRTRFSDLSASIRRDRVPEPEPEPEPPVKKGMSAVQAKKVIAEAMKLNEELSQLVANLQARQEESDVSTSLHSGVPKLTCPSTSILSLSSVLSVLPNASSSFRVEYLICEFSLLSSPMRAFSNQPISEQELHENDDELQHLRICLKAVEIQMPPHPDKELQRCISSFKQDYQVLKRKRASRSSFATISSVDSTYPGSPYPGSPSR